MEIERSTVVAGPIERVFDVLDDLGEYPAWMDLVHDVADVASAPDAPAWDVELRAQVGPFARSKRLRMVRTVHEPPHRVVFERSEIDGRSHSTWTLTAALSPRPPDTVEVTMTLVYGGNLFSGAVLQRVLDDHVERGAAALARLLASPEPPIKFDRRGDDESNGADR